MNWETLQQTLRQLVREKRGAQAEIARRRGISTASVAAYIAGGNAIPAEHLDTILEILGLEFELGGLARRGPLAPENLTHTDAAVANMASVGEFGVSGVRAMRPQDFAVLVLGDGPSAHLPDEVSAYLYRARACMAYAGFYFPFLSVGAGQLGLAAEAGLRTFAEQAGIPVRQSNGRSIGMSSLIDRLSNQGHLTAQQTLQWRAILDNRNELFHPKNAPVFSLGLVMPYLTGITEALVALFPAPFEDLPS
ncbi:helix-turn-helix transcriptional regulator [Deinococcus sp. QL22]|uniref:helix-turn-helix domain-containing protein n=1 Tax=Deinococcus sp. QL22 TaxID=2939437 RepID=UPI002017E985|nr:helix-turn-helix transcriptional regulator [Deinococcus sp. QL22]UQN10332.1 helix-turn-helix domain-containing protein [Deinococcus sp. QL22]UQN10466.1 helix-turn-helix domain-containing protein [Deinococcus sp. QL22]